jgi:2-dehydropantoate 2-reductase
MREAVAGIARSMATQISSTAHDVARGKPSEIDHLNGYVVQRGAALGIATPVNRVLHSLVRLIESRATHQGKTE